MKRKASRPGVTGFTLIEILVVVAIIALLISIVMPAFAEVRRVSKKSVCKHNLHQISVGMQAYLQSNRDFFPFAARFPSKEAPVATLAGRDPYPPLPLALGRELAVSRPPDLTIYMQELSQTGKRGPNPVFECPADAVSPEKADTVAPLIVMAGGRYYDTQTTSYEWENTLDGLKLNVRTILLLRDLFAARFSDVPMLTEFEPYHGGPNRRGSLNVLYADFHVDSDNYIP